MKSFKILNLVFVLFGTLQASAAAKGTSLKLEVNFGDKVNVFEIPDSAKLDVVVNGRKRKTLRGNIDSALKLATAAAKEKSNDRSLCSRKYIELNLEVKGAKPSRTIGCIDSKTPAAVKLTELSNLMLFM